MNALRKALADYFAVRRALGFKLYRAEKLLNQFLTFVEEPSVPMTLRHRPPGNLDLGA
jgi:hypothetical protein